LRSIEPRWHDAGCRHSRRGSRAGGATRGAHARWADCRRAASMITLIALRNFVLRPWRSLFLLLGYSLGVAVMIVLLSIGEALLSQARQERLIGGGQVTILPEGIDVEVLKTGGLGGMFFSIDHARFIYRQLLAAPRLAPWIASAAPQIDSKLLYLRAPNGREIAVEATGEIPSLNRAVGAAADLARGRWEDDDLD